MQINLALQVYQTQLTRNLRLIVVLLQRVVAVALRLSPTIPESPFSEVTQVDEGDERPRASTPRIFVVRVKLSAYTLVLKVLIASRDSDRGSHQRTCVRH